MTMTTIRMLSANYCWIISANFMMIMIVRIDRGLSRDSMVYIMTMTTIRMLSGNYCWIISANFMMIMIVRIDRGLSHDSMV